MVLLVTAPSLDIPRLALGLRRNRAYFLDYNETLIKETFMFLKKEGPPIFVEVYVDGRAHARTPHPCTRREIALLKLFEKGVEDGEIRGTEPGQYHFNFTKVGLFNVEAKLSPCD